MLQKIAISDSIRRAQWRNSILKEIVRKAIHMGGCVVPFAAALFGKNATITVLLALLFCYLLSETLRLRGLDLPFISKLTQVASRKRDENKIVLGPVTLVVGIVSALLIAPPPFSTLGIFALSFGDGSASLAGKLFGRISLPFTNGKTVEGSLTCFFAVFVASFVVCKSSSASFVLAFITMGVEALPLVDFDNLAIPIVATFCARFLLG